MDQVQGKRQPLICLKREDTKQCSGASAERTGGFHFEKYLAMKTKSKSIRIHSTPEKVFTQMDDFSKTGMHMSESSMMMMGSKLKLEQLSINSTGVGAKYRWYGKMMGMTMDFSETVTKWQSPKLKEWEIVGDAKMIIMSWYRMWFEITPADNGTIIKISISYLPPKELFYKILSFFFANWYCNWCLNNMLNDTKKSLEKKTSKQAEGGVQVSIIRHRRGIGNQTCRR